MNVAAEIVLLAQHARHFHHLLHRVVRALDDARTQEQAFDVVAAVKAQGEVDHLIDVETRTRHIAAHAIDAVDAIVDTEVGQQDFQQRDTAAVWRITVADAHARGRTYAFAVGRGALVRSAGSAGSIIFGGIGQDFEFALELHMMVFTMG